MCCSNDIHMVKHIHHIEVLTKDRVRAQSSLTQWQPSKTTYCLGTRFKSLYFLTHWLRVHCLSWVNSISLVGEILQCSTSVANDFTRVSLLSTGVCRMLNVITVTNKLCLEMFAIWAVLICAVCAIECAEAWSNKMENNCFEHYWCLFWTLSFSVKFADGYKIICIWDEGWSQLARVMMARLQFFTPLIRQHFTVTLHK